MIAVALGIEVIGIWVAIVLSKVFGEATSYTWIKKTSRLNLS
ncbi:MAG: hypothetical protein QXM55_04830 [Ignisphaera sp.]